MVEMGTMILFHSMLNWSKWYSFIAMLNWSTSASLLSDDSIKKGPKFAQLWPVLSPRIWTGVVKSKTWFSKFRILKMMLFHQREADVKECQKSSQSWHKVNSPLTPNGLVQPFAGQHITPPSPFTQIAVEFVISTSGISERLKTIVGHPLHMPHQQILTRRKIPWLNPSCIYLYI